jgi:hypothetical protein
MIHYWKLAFPLGKILLTGKVSSNFHEFGNTEQLDGAL